MVCTQQGSSVDVQIDAAPAVNLNEELQEMREKYEALILQNHQQIEQWFQTKVTWLFEWMHGWMDGRPDLK